nr:cytochrome P450 2U1-like [Lytechinus pictus]
MSISLGPGPNVVVLTSLAVVKELLVKHADCTSDRRIPPLLGLAFSTKAPLYNKLRQDIDQYKRFMKEVVKDHKRNQVSNDGENGDGIRKNSFEDVTDRYLQQMQHGSIVAVEEEDIWRVMFDLMGAGTETTSETLLWGILYLSLYPDVQKQIHSEIDEMTLQDTDYVIHYDQRKSLPYTQAAILEVLRCACVAPLSLPRVTTRDLTVMGYSIPKGVEIWVNEWAINRDKNIWSDSNEFNPGRFLDDSGRIDPKRKESIIAFGEGRRMCLGRCLAEHMLFMFFTNLLRWFSFRLPEDGRTRPNVNRGNFGLTYSPPLFDVIITPRDID